MEPKFNINQKVNVVFNHKLINGIINNIEYDSDYESYVYSIKMSNGVNIINALEKHIKEY